MIRAFETLKKLKISKEETETKYRVAMQAEHELEKEIEETIKEVLLVKNVSVGTAIVKVENDTYFIREGEFKLLQLGSPNDKQSEVIKLLNMNIER